MLSPLAWWRARRDARELAAVAAITRALGDVPESSGLPLMRQTGLSSSRVYVALARMERDGQVVFPLG